MLSKLKINLKTYAVASFFLFFTSLFFLRGGLEVFVVLGIFLTGVLTHWMFLQGIYELFEENRGISTRRKRAKILLYMAGKFLIFGVAIALGVHFIGSRVVIALVNYVFQIFILVYSKVG